MFGNVPTLMVTKLKELEVIDIFLGSYILLCLFEYFDFFKY